MEGHNVSTKNKKKKSYLKWTLEMDKVLTNVLLEQHNMGNKTANGWKSPAYTAAISSIMSRFDVAITRDNILSRLKTWNTHYLHISDMLSQSGFAWNCAANQISIESEEVWNAYVKARPEANKYRGKTIENWDDLVTICGQDRATGEGAETGEEAIGNTNIVHESDSEEVNDTISTTRENSQKSGPSSHGSRKRHRSSETLAGAVNHMALSIDKLYESETFNVPPQKILDLLSQISDLEQSQFLIAFDIMIADGRKFEALSCLPDHLKKPWLLMQIGRVEK